MHPHPHAITLSHALCTALASLLLSCSTTRAQTATAPDSSNPYAKGPGWYAEAKLGVNRTTMQANPTVREPFVGEVVSDIYTGGTGMSLRFGGSIARRLTPMLALELDLSYDRRGISRSGASKDSCGLTEVDGRRVGRYTIVGTRNEYALGVEYFSIGLQGRLNLGPFFLFGGPTASLPMGQWLEETITLEDGCIYWYGTSDSTSVVSGVLYDADALLRISLTMGAGLDLEVGRGIGVVCRMAYDMGFARSYESGGWYEFRRPGTRSGRYFNADFNGDIEMSALQATIGVRVDLSRGTRR